MDSCDRSEDAFVGEVCKAADAADWLVVEDIPHNLGRFDSGMKHVCRIQGRIVHELDGMDLLDRLVFVPPATWQRHYDGVWRAGAKGARAAAKARGYTPPNILADWELSLRLPPTGPERQKVREQAKKIMSDYVDAYLIAAWAQEKLVTHVTLLDVATVSRYE